MLENLILKRKEKNLLRHRVDQANANRQEKALVTLQGSECFVTCIGCLQPIHCIGLNQLWLLMGSAQPGFSSNSPIQGMWATQFQKELEGFKRRSTHDPLATAQKSKHSEAKEGSLGLFLAAIGAGFLLALLYVASAQTEKVAIKEFTVQMDSGEFYDEEEVKLNQR